MFYMLLIVELIEQCVECIFDEGQVFYVWMVDFVELLKVCGVLCGVELFEWFECGMCVQVCDGEMCLFDGLFVEVKEMVGGFFFVDVDMCEEVIEIVCQCLVV